MTVKRYDPGCAYVGEEEMIVASDGDYVSYDDYAELQRKVEVLDAENCIQDYIISAVKELTRESSGVAGWHLNGDIASWDEVLPELNHSETKSTDAAIAEIVNKARAEGIYFTANRLLAAWDAGFIDSPDKEVIDVARMILSSAEMLPDAVDGDFSRDFADEMMEELKKQLRKESDHD